MPSQLRALIAVDGEPAINVLPLQERLPKRVQENCAIYKPHWEVARDMQQNIQAPVAYRANDGQDHEKPEVTQQCC
jgi:hypothetical protein